MEATEAATLPVSAEELAAQAAKAVPAAGMQLDEEGTALLDVKLEQEVPPEEPLHALEAAILEELEADEEEENDVDPETQPFSVHSNLQESKELSEG